MTLDFSTNLHYFWALLPEFIICAWGIGILIAGVSGKRDPRSGGDDTAELPSHDLGFLTLAGLAVAALANGWLYGVSETGTAGLVTVDQYRLFANWIFLIAAGLGVTMSFTYVYRQRLQAGEYYGLILLATSGMMFMAAARDLIVIFLGLEVMSIAAYALTAFNRRDRRSAEAGLKYFILGAFSTGFFLYGLTLVWGAVGSTNLAQIGWAVQTGEAEQGLLVTGIAMFVVGFGFKVGVVPFHMWTPDVYEGAPTPITAWMAVAVKAAAVVAFFRVFISGFLGAYAVWYPIVWWLAAITMVAANLLALAQFNVKRMLAYSSIAHAGYLLVALAAANDVASGGMLFYLLVYAIMNMGVFAVVVIVGRQGEENAELDDWAGLGASQPLLAVFLTIFLLALAGFPGTGGFMGKIFLLQGAVDSNLWILSTILVLMTVVSYYYYLRLAWYVWMREPQSEQGHDALFIPLPMRVALAGAAAAILILGVFPAATMDFAQQSAAAIWEMSAAMAARVP